MYMCACVFLQLMNNNLICTTFTHLGFFIILLKSASQTSSQFEPVHMVKYSMIYRLKYLFIYFSGNQFDNYTSIKYV